jgi:chromosome segregation ATPase
LALAASAAPSNAADVTAPTAASGATPAAAALAADLEALKGELAALQARLAELEAAQQAGTQKLEQTAEQAESLARANTEQQEAIDRGADNLARALGESAASGWLARWQRKGDLRYRNETIDQQYTTAVRRRDRIRARFGVMARVNEPCAWKCRLRPLRAAMHARRTSR